MLPYAFYYHIPYTAIPYATLYFKLYYASHCMIKREFRAVEFVELIQKKDKSCIFSSIFWN